MEQPHEIVNYQYMEVSEVMGVPLNHSFKSDVLL